MNHGILLLAMIALLAQGEQPRTGTCTLVVQVVDEAGNPVAGVPLRVSVGKDVRDGATGESGAAEFTSLPCGEASVAAGPTAWDRPQWAGTTRTLRPDTPAAARLVVVARTEVTIRVLDTKGRPVLSGLVSGSSIEGSDARGTPSDKGLVKIWAQPGSWRFYWADQPTGFAHGLSGRWVYHFGGEVLVEVGREPKTVDLVIQSRERLEGTVVDADGQPVRGVEVVLRAPASADLLGAATTFADGRFALELWDFPMVVEPVAFDRALSFDPPRLTLSEPPSAPMTFVARASKRPLLRGRVVRKDTGAVVPDASVSAWPQCGGSVPEGLGLADVGGSMGKADGNGSFEVRCLPECPLHVSAYAEPGSGAIDLPAGACEREVVVEIEKQKNWVLEGTVTDRKGTPLEGVPLSLARFTEKRGNSDSRWIPLAFGHTGESGRFRLAGPWSGHWRLQVARRDAPKDLRNLVLVSKRSPGTRFEIDLEPEDARKVEVRAIPGATVCARALVENRPATLSEFALFAEDAEVVVEKVDRREGGGQKDGRLCVEGIIPGRYRIRIGNPSMSIPSWYPGTEDRAGAVLLAVSSGMNDLEPLTLRPAGLLHLDLPGWAGPDLPRIEYREPLAENVEPAPWTAVAEERVQSDDEGTWLITLPVGTWELRACASPRCEKEEATWHTEKPIEMPRGQVKQAALVLHAAAPGEPPDPP